MSLLKTIFYYPLLNLLVYFYGIFGSFGASIVVVTILVRFVLFYFSKNAMIAQKKMADLQPELKKIQEKYKNNKQEQTKATTEFYKTNKVNPFSGCLPLLIQMPVLISLYYVFLKGINSINPEDLYSFVSLPNGIDFNFLGFFDLSQPSKILAFLAGVSQFLQSKYASHTQKNMMSGEFATMMNYQMTYFFPVLTFLIGLTLPSGLALYWTIGAIFSIIQQLVIEKYYVGDKKQQVLIDKK